MRIVASGQSMETMTSSTDIKVVNVSENTESTPVDNVSQVNSEINVIPGEEKEFSKEALQQAVNAVNDFLDINNSSSKFVYHEGLQKYYVTIVNRNTDEVIKEIPPKKLLDAFYEMQKMVGMIVDEKI